MLEIYILWYFVVKKNLEKKVLLFTPILFMLQVIITNYCDIMDLDWSLRMNFAVRGLAWFMLGYYISLVAKDKLMRISNITLILMVLCSASTILLIVIINFEINIYDICCLFYSLGLFCFAIKNYNLSLSKAIEYIGDKLSLNIYIFHTIIGTLLNYGLSEIFKINTKNTVYLWMRPIIVLLLSIAFAYFLLLIAKKAKKLGIKQKISLNK